MEVASVLPAVKPAPATGLDELLLMPRCGDNVDYNSNRIQSVIRGLTSEQDSLRSTSSVDTFSHVRICPLSFEGEAGGLEIRSGLVGELGGLSVVVGSAPCQWS